ncbi:sensor histidine kinase [Engelhardtia mirabilis]|uniref:histidine kinase n=1 Tax=Engelhardtia mirabilis TaxID=2528011 RepID=A0A518BNL8_9BACT|nr:Sensor kinase CusS [Planctomycetes bacterium Pla133]QDV02896.1 Sensor kinase CusS [Planctomycetes bacterium Pla86]
MKSPGWTLRNRLRLTFGLLSVGLVVAIGLVSTWWLGQGALDQLAALSQEEVHEFSVLFDTGNRSDELAKSIALQLDAEHIDVELGWRVKPAGAPVYVIDPHGLLPRLPAGGLQDDGPVHLERGVVAFGMTTQEGTRVELVLDGMELVDRLRGFEWALVVLLLGALALGCSVGEFASRRVAAMLAGVASAVRAQRDAESPLEVLLEHPPEEVREVAEELQRMLERIRAENESARVMTAGLAHELRAPIQNLIGETEVCLMSEREPAEYAGVLGEQLGSLHELADAVDNLLALCRDRQTTEPTRAERFDLTHEIELRSGRWRRSAERAGVDLRFELGGGLALDGDREAILRAVRNLVANALSVSPVGAAVEVCLRGDAKSVELTVDDRGPGIPATERTRVFEPFYRGASAAGKRAGYGLGLALVRAAVDAHRGSVQIEERSGGGTRFRLTLPRAGGATPHQGLGAA